MLFRIVTFNVNGLRSYSKFITSNNSNINDYLKNKLKATILCVQESRGSKQNLIEFHTLRDYITFTSPNTGNSGTYGVSTFIRKNFFCSGKAEQIEEFKEYNGTGRFILTKHGSFNILNCYFPFVSESEYRSNDDVCVKKRKQAMRFSFYVEKYLKNNPNTILCGDFNAVYNIHDTYLYHQEAIRIQNMANCHNKCCKERIMSDEEKYRGNNTMEHNTYSFCDERNDSTIKRFANPILSPTKLPFFFTDVKYLIEYFFELENRQWLYRLIHEKKYVDTYRQFSKKQDVYSCWNSMLNLRKSNLGTRIDLILVPEKFKINVVDAGLMTYEYGSDHCPAFADLKIKIDCDENNSVKKCNNLLDYFKLK